MADLFMAAPGPGQGNAETLRDYWAHGKGAAQIRWGSEGDFDRCVRLVTEHAHMSPDQAKGYCNLVHHKALGFYPATHKKMMKGAAGDVPQGPQLVTVPDVEILAAGTWKLSSGRQTFTRDDLKHAVEATKCPAVGQPVIKIGHLDKRFTPSDGEPALGRVTNLRTDKAGVKLLGDLAGMPGWLAGISASAFPRRSVEGSYGYRCQIGHDHPFVITGLALLGVTQPGVGVLQDLKDLSNLFYHAAGNPSEPGRAWRTGPIEHAGDVMPVTEEDVRRAYYAGGDVPQSWWITELQMDPSQLIVTDGEGAVYRVPFKIAGSGVDFGDAEPLESYADLAASRGSGAVLVFASAEESRQFSTGQHTVTGGGEPPDEDGLDASWDDPSGLPDLSGLTVADLEAVDSGQAAASADDLEAAAKLGSGARFKALQSALKAKGAKNPGALAAWIGRKKYGKARFAKLAGAARKTAHAAGPQVSADGTHDSHTGKHTHAHPAFGAQGDDEMHEHEHSHAGDAVHEHDHGTQAGAGNKRGASDVEFTEDQIASLRASLGLDDDQELTTVQIVEGVKKQRLAAKRGAPNGLTVTIDKADWDRVNADLKAAKEFQDRMRVKERDQVIAAAVRDGRFSAARKPLYVRAWDADPEGARELIENLPKNAVPISDIGAALGGEDDLLEEEYRDLFNPNSPAGGFRR